MTNRSIFKFATYGGIALAILITAYMTAGLNNNGYRTVVQWPNGTTFVKFTPGLYFTVFGIAEEYVDVLTYDYDKNDDSESTINQIGIPVRYQDGGLGTIFGKDRFALPNDEETMLKLHKAFRTSEGLGTKLIKPVVEQATNLTAGLMSSEAAYAEKRTEFIQLSQSQISKGRVLTHLEEVTVKDEEGKDVLKKVPVVSINEKTGESLHAPSDLDTYGISLQGHQITDWDFEKKTLDQISAKREATMAIITAKANAARAVQDAITAEAKGKANVMKAKYEKEVIKEQAVVDATREKEVAIIAAERKVDVAAQAKLEAEQRKLASIEYEQEQIHIGQGEGERKRIVMQADGALQQKLSAWENVNARYATALAAHRLVPDIMIGGSEGEQVNGAQSLIDMLMINQAKQLGLDMSMKAQPQVQ